MEAYTVQLAKWRIVKKLDIELIDITIKTGIVIFAPTYSLVLSHKAGKLSDEEYTKQYRDMMLKSYMTNTIIWTNLLQKEKIALACYCGPDKFCHRHLLVKYLEGVCHAQNIPFRYLGEIE